MDLKIRKLQRRAACGDGEAIDKLYHMALFPAPLAPMAAAWLLMRQHGRPFPRFKSRAERDAVYAPNVRWSGPIAPHWHSTKRRIAISLGMDGLDVYNWNKRSGDVVIEGVTFRLLPQGTKSARRLLIVCPGCDEAIPAQSWRKHAHDRH